MNKPIIPRKPQNKVIHTSYDLAIITMITIFFLALLLLSGCTTTYIPAEERCQKAGLQVDTMNVGEQPNKNQEVVVTCSKYPSLLKPKGVK